MKNLNDILGTAGGLPLDHPLIGLTPAGVRHWITLDGWDMKESALLLAGANPLKIQEFGRDENITPPDYTTCGYWGIFHRLEVAEKMGALRFPASPADVLRWAKGKNALPEILEQCLSFDPAEITPLPPTGVTAKKARNKWTPANLKELRDKFQLPGATASRLAKEYEVSPQAIRAALKKTAPRSATTENAFGTKVKSSRY